MCIYIYIYTYIHVTMVRFKETSKRMSAPACVLTTLAYFAVADLNTNRSQTYPAR